MAKDWATVARAMKSRLAELDMTQAELIQRSRLAPVTIRELLFNTAQRRRSDQTLAAVSAALGWPPDYLRAVSEGHDPGALSAGNPVLTELAVLKERLGSVEQGLAALGEKADRIERRLAEIDEVQETVGLLQAQLIDLYHRTGHMYPLGARSG